MPRRPRRGAPLRAAAALAALLGPAAAAPALATSGPTAQIQSGQLFLGTTKVEMGARANGSLGSSSAAPAGFHPRTTFGSILGLRVNPAECDWDDAGCVTHGDFVAPGDPYEAWGVQIGGGPPAINSAYQTAIAGAFTAADADAVAGEWRSSADVAGVLAVSLTHAVPAYGWLLDQTVALTNTSAAPVEDVYVLRAADPDNCSTQTAPVCDRDGDGAADGALAYQTRNTVVSQGAPGSAAVVTATQTDGSFLALRALGGDARAVRQVASFHDPSSIRALWHGTDGAFASSGTGFGDAGIATVVRVPSIAPGATATVRFQYLLKDVPQAAALAAVAPRAGVVVDVPAANGGAAATGVCSPPAHGTAAIEGGRIRYTPAPGYAGADAFTYSVGGPCGPVSLTVEPAPAAPDPGDGGEPRDEPVAVPAAPLEARTRAGGTSAVVRLTLPLPGRYTFIYTDASGRRVGQAKGSRIGSRTLRHRHSAPVLVTRAEGTAVRLAARLTRHVPRGLRLRIIRRTPDGALSEVVLRP